MESDLNHSLVDGSDGDPIREEAVEDSFMEKHEKKASKDIFERFGTL